jgi:hypothetical protein
MFPEIIAIDFNDAAYDANFVVNKTKQKDHNHLKKNTTTQ